MHQSEISVWPEMRAGTDWDLGFQPGRVGVPCVELLQKAAVWMLGGTESVEGRAGDGMLKTALHGEVV